MSYRGLDFSRSMFGSGKMRKECRFSDSVKEIETNYGVYNDYFDLKEGHNASITSLEFFPKLNKMVSAAGDKTLRVWNMETKKSEKEIMEDDNFDEIIKWNDEVCLVSNHNGKIFSFTLPDLEVIREYPLPKHLEAGKSFCRRLLKVTSDEFVALYNVLSSEGLNLDGEEEGMLFLRSFSQNIPPKLLVHDANYEIDGYTFIHHSPHLYPQSFLFNCNVGKESFSSSSTNLSSIDLSSTKDVVLVVNFETGKAVDVILPPKPSWIYLLDVFTSTKGKETIVFTSERNTVNIMELPEKILVHTFRIFCGIRHSIIVKSRINEIPTTVALFGMPQKGQLIMHDVENNKSLSDHSESDVFVVPQFTSSKRPMRKLILISQEKYRVRFAVGSRVGEIRVVQFVPNDMLVFDDSSDVGIAEMDVKERILFMLCEAESYLDEFCSDGHFCIQCNEIRFENIPKLLFM